MSCVAHLPNNLHMTTKHGPPHEFFLLHNKPTEWGANPANKVDIDMKEH